jgi:tetratricopeptide (TPR) repeat protein
VQYSADKARCRTPWYAVLVDDLAAVLAQARAALKTGEAETAVRFYRRAQELSPRDPEIPHECGLALLERGDIGLAALAQGQARALDSGHIGARAQRAAALAALGDDAGAARDLRELLSRLGPQPSLSARLYSLEQSAQAAAARRLVGAAPARLAASPLVGSALARNISDPLVFRAPFAELRAQVRDGKLARLEFVFDSMDASLGRSDLSYGGSTEDEHGRRVPLDEFTAAGIVFLSEALGIETVRARRMLSFLLAPECGLGPHRFAGVDVGWTIDGGNGERRYGLFGAL